MELDRRTRRQLGHIDIDPTWDALEEEGGRKVTADMRRRAKKHDFHVVNINGYRMAIEKTPRIYKCVRNDGGYWVTCFEHPDIEVCRRMLQLNKGWRKAW